MTDLEYLILDLRIENQYERHPLSGRAADALKGIADENHQLHRDNALLLNRQRETKAEIERLKDVLKKIEEHKRLDAWVHSDD